METNKGNKMKYKLGKFEKCRFNRVAGWSYEVFEKQDGCFVFYGQFFAKTKKEAKQKWGIE